MKKLILFPLLFLLLTAFTGQRNDSTARWMRYPAISPDGRTIAFCYKGNIYAVSSEGGEARALTVGSAYNFKPVWSPDGSQIAFASDRHGHFDVFVMPAAGGVARRLTFHSANDIPQCFGADGQSVLFTSGRMTNPENCQFPYGRFTQLYSVPLNGDRPAPVLPMPLDDAQFSPDGRRLLYIDHKGYEDIWRKKHTSSVTRDVWVYDPAQNSHVQLTGYAGEDRNPVWAPGGDAFFFLSERSGVFNVWKSDLNAASAPRQISMLQRHPIRFLSVASNGLLCYGHHGDIYTQREGAAPRKLSIQVAADQAETPAFETMTGNATEMALSPNGKEVAFVVRGEVFVTSVEGGLTKRITNTPEQERSVQFSPDGRHIVYAGERNGSWNLYQSSIADESEPYFYAATLITETPLLETSAETFQPAYSPDGKELAFLEERTTLRVLNLESRQTRTVLPGDKNYSYSDGDQYYQWSPDSKWFLVTFIDRQRWVSEVGLIKADGQSPVVNLSNSGYSEGRLTWAFKGNAALFLSDREGFRSHGSWGAQTDLFVQYFNDEGWKRFQLGKEEYAILKEKEDKDKEKEKEKDGDADNDKAKTKRKDKEAPPKDKDKKEPVKDLNIELEGIEDRVARLTLSSSFINSFALSPDGEKLYYLSARDGGADLWEMQWREKKVKTIANFKSGGGAIALDEKGENLYVLNAGSIARIKTADGKSEPVSFKAEMYVDKAKEREYHFEHIWRQVNRKFYLPDLHGADWTGLKADYAELLPHIGNTRDFAEMASELLGELNASHTGCRYFHSDPKGDQTAALGFFEDYAYKGPGVRIAELMDKSPLRLADPRIRPGAVIEQIDGQAIASNQNYYPLLNHKAGKTLSLTIFDPADNARRVIKPKAISLGEQAELLYERWVKTRRAETERLSGGRLGYVHVRGMNSPSFRQAYSELLGRYNDKEAVIVDTRFNGGGWLHDDLATLLSGRQYVRFMPRGQFIGSEPQNKWQKPSAVLAGEGNYSDAHFFPVAYRALGIGPVIGMPIPGTSTAVWWETLIDPALVFGIPQVGIQGEDGRYLENLQFEPDIRVKNMPGDFIKGRDAQLERAVEWLLNKK